MTTPDFDEADCGLRVVEIDEGHVGERIDKVLADKLAELSRGRVQALIAQDLISFDGQPVKDGSTKAKAGLYRVLIPPTAPAEPVAENIPLSVLFEDEHLIVIDKPAGMAAHPAPGSETGTLVNALLQHCGDSLSGIGGVARPGIVHRLDKDTSGVMVAAKTDAAHHGLQRLFEAHDIERAYVALTRSAPKSRAATLTTRIGRSTTDRKKMAVLRSAISGREATTHYVVNRTYGPDERPFASRITCRLETGRTHQIRVHLASLGAPCLGDALYGSGQPTLSVREAMAHAGLTRQALHAAILGFVHPVSGHALRFETPLPPDMAALEDALARL